MTQRRRPRGRNITGILVLDKAQGMSSNACLQEAKRLFEAEKAGHTGSLDPLATGVLPLCFGDATKISQFLLDSDKRYHTVLRLGLRTDSADSQGTVISERPVAGISRVQVEEALQQFRGNIEQTPPMYSALKHQGTPLYKLARSGQEIEREARPVTVYALELLDYMEGDILTVALDIHCSKGTYVRTIADDLGEILGCGAHVIALRRVQAGAFDEAQCVTIDHLRETREAGGLEALDAYLHAADQAVADLPEVILPGISAGYVRQGQAVMARHLPLSGLVRLYDEDRFIGIGTILEDGRVAPKRLFTQ